MFSLSQRMTVSMHPGQAQNPSTGSLSSFGPGIRVQTHLRESATSFKTGPTKRWVNPNSISSDVRHIFKRLGDSKSNSQTSDMNSSMVFLYRMTVDATSTCSPRSLSSDHHLTLSNYVGGTAERASGNQITHDRLNRTARPNEQRSFCNEYEND